MGLSQALVSLLFQLLNALYSTALRSAQTFRRPKTSTPFSELPTFIAPNRTSSAFGKPLCAGRGAPGNLGVNQSEDILRNSVNDHQSWHFPDVPLITLESGRQSRAIRANEASSRSKRLNRILVLPTKPISHRDTSPMRSCDAVLEIIHSVILTNSSARGTVPSERVKSDVRCSSTSASTIPSIYSTQSVADSLSVTLSEGSWRTPMVSTRDPQTIGTQKTAAEPTIGALGRRRGFKGAPICVRAVSLSRKLSPALLKPMTTGSKELFSFVYPSLSPRSDSLDKGFPDGLTKADPFSIKSAGSFYATDILTFDIPRSNLYNFSVYRPRSTRIRSHLKFNRRDLFYNQHTTVYDMSIDAYATTPNCSSETTSLGLTFRRVSRQASGSDAGDIVVKDPGSGHTFWSDSTTAPVSEIDIGTANISTTSTTLTDNDSVTRPAPIYHSTPRPDPSPTALEPRHHDPPLAGQPNHCLRPLILPELHKLRLQAVTGEASGRRSQALEEIINLLNMGPSFAFDAATRARNKNVAGNGGPMEDKSKGVSVDVVDMYHEVYAI